MHINSTSQVELPLGRELSFLGKSYLLLLRARLHHLDIDRNYLALVLIESEEGMLSQQELAKYLGTDKVSIVRVIDYLSEKGYVKRMKKIDDRRKYSLVLTEKAKKALPEIKRSISEVNKIALNGLPGEEISALWSAIGKIKNNLTENILSL